MANFYYRNSVIAFWRQPKLLISALFVDGFLNSKRQIVRIDVKNIVGLRDDFYNYYFWQKSSSKLMLVEKELISHVQNMFLERRSLKKGGLLLQKLKNPIHGKCADAQ